MNHKTALLWSWLVWAMTFFMPDVSAIRRLRGVLYGMGMKGRGRNFQVSSNVIIRGLENLTVGDNVYLAPGVVVLAGDSISLGNDVQVAFYCVLTDGNHTANDGSYRFGARAQSPIRIEAGSWIGSHVTVVAGVRIGSGVVIGANSVVTRDIPDGVLAAGVPAAILRDPSNRV